MLLMARRPPSTARGWGPSVPPRSLNHWLSPTLLKPPSSPKYIKCMYYI